jgi:hypothetical protein
MQLQPLPHHTCISPGFSPRTKQRLDTKDRPAYLLYNILTTKRATFWDVMPCCLVHRHFGGTYCSGSQGRNQRGRRGKLRCPLAWLRLRRLKEFVPPKRRWICTRRYIPEDGTPHGHRCKSLKSNDILFGMYSAVPVTSRIVFIFHVTNERGHCPVACA